MASGRWKFTAPNRENGLKCLVGCPKMQITSVATQAVPRLSLACPSGDVISESFSNQIGNMGNLNTQAGTWTTGKGINSQGQLTDYLSAGGVPGLSSLSGAAFQMFTATGQFNGIPFMQPLGVSGVGSSPTTTVLSNVYTQRHNQRVWARNEPKY
jgi:hypothetical protein